MAKVQTYRCYGGPLDGHSVTEQYAGDDYVRYNSASGVEPIYEKVEYQPGKFVWRKVKGQFVNPSVVLVYYPTPERKTIYL